MIADLIDNYNGLMPNGEMNSNCFVNDSLTPKLPLCTGGIFATYPNALLRTGSGFYNEVIRLKLNILMYSFIP